MAKIKVGDVYRDAYNVSVERATFLLNGGIVLSVTGAYSVGEYAKLAKHVSEMNGSVEVVVHHEKWTFKFYGKGH